MIDIGRSMIVLGIIILLTGVFLTFSGKVPFIGRLPGDIFIQKNGFTFYFPLTTSLIVSIILSILIRLFNK